MNRYKFIGEGKKHLHTLDGKPLMGTTTLIKEVLPPPLAWYGSRKALEPMGWTNPKKVSREEGVALAMAEQEKLLNMDKDAWYDFLQECYRNHDEFKKERAKEGTYVHTLVENYVETCIREFDGEPQLFSGEKYAPIQKFINWAVDNVDEFFYTEVHVYSEKLWLGGQLDLIYRKDGKNYLGDIKTTQAVYASHIMQDGLYHYQLAENGVFDKNGNQKDEPFPIHAYSVIRLSNGTIDVREYHDTERMMEFSANLVQLYKTKQALEKLLANSK